MKYKIPGRIAIASVSLLFIISVPVVLSQSHDTAIPVGKSTRLQINCSERAGGFERYDATIALLEVVRGSKAWELLKAADSSNPEPETGYEYILARLGFKMKALGAPGDKTFDLGRPMQLTAFSKNFEEYAPSKIVSPMPEFKGRTPADEYTEGWAAFSIKQEDDQPLMMFDPSSGGAWSRGKIIFFRLYE
jgi:hypothetical protein